jgi:hypothetical protein
VEGRKGYSPYGACAEDIDEYEEALKKCGAPWAPLALSPRSQR